MGAQGEGLLRRLVDIVAASALLVLSAPLLMLGMALVLWDTGRPIFYRQSRVGQTGERFRCWKLRTMVVGAETWLEEDSGLKQRYIRNGYKLTASDDPRITRHGRFLRLTYLDEIPQLINVLSGSMTLVGPRPVVPAELTEYEPEVSLLLGVKPGVFGEWTALGRQRPGYPARAEIELEYVRNRTVRRDIAILLRNFMGLRHGHPGERAR